MIFRLVLILVFVALPDAALAQNILPILSAVEGSSGSTEYSVTLQLLGLMTVLTLLPSILLMTTSFTRIIIVLSLLRQALGTAQTPPNMKSLPPACLGEKKILNPNWDGTPRQLALADSSFRLTHSLNHSLTH